MPQFHTLLTDIGQAKLANAVALGNTIEITHLAVGDGNGSMPTPETTRTALVNEVRRAPINTSHVDDENPNWIVVEQIIPPDVGGWTIREVGIFDSTGDLIAYGNYPETYKPVLDEGSSRTQTVRFVMEVSDTAAVTLKIDPSVVLATRQYVDNQDSERLAKAANLGDLTDVEQALANLGLGAAAVADIIGVVSQSGGIPTGAIIERGSNANGEYVRYADGTQICNRTYGAFGVSALQTPVQAEWTYPAAFSGAGDSLSTSLQAAATATNGAEICGIILNAVRSGENPDYSTKLVFYGRAVEAISNSTHQIHCIAIGRWF